MFVLDATPGVFEAHMEDGPHAQTKEHLSMVKALGNKQARPGL